MLWLCFCDRVQPVAQHHCPAAAVRLFPVRFVFFYFHHIFLVPTWMPLEDLSMWLFRSNNVCLRFVDLQMSSAPQGGALLNI